MVNLHTRDPLLGFLAGNIKLSAATEGSATNVVGGTITVGTFDSDSSGLLTFPPFKDTPVIVGQVKGGDTTTSVGGFLTFTGVGVSNAYLRMGPTPASTVTVGIAIAGKVQL